MTQVCLSREFLVLAAGRTSPVVAWLRELAAAEHRRCGGPGVGVVGLCFSGGFAVAMAVDPRVLAPVAAQPSLPLPVTKSRRRGIDCSPAGLDDAGTPTWVCRMQGDRHDPVRGPAA